MPQSKRLAPLLVLVACAVFVASSTGAEKTGRANAAGIDPAEYRRIAASFGTEAGIAYRYGSPAAGAAPSHSHPGPRASKPMGAVSVQNPNGKGSRGCGWNGWCGNFQIGTLRDDPGDYSSSILNVAYVPDAKPGPQWPAPRYFGVASLQALSVAHSTVSWAPEVSWATYDGASHDGGANDENTERFAGVKPGSPIGTIPMDGKPVAMARGYGRGGWINNVLTVFANGWITSAGSNTSHNFVKLKLPDGKTPTAIAITNSGEFALVTVWDTVDIKGQVAVIALADGCQGCETQPESQWNANWGNSRQAYPGFPGLGNYLGAKLLGFVDLPADVKAPTEIGVTTGRSHERGGGYQAVMNLWNEPLNTAAQRARFYDGDLKAAIGNTGMAVVVSKSEQRAVFVDMEPLFRHFRAQYVGPQTDAQWRARIADRGDGDSRFPPTFAAVPKQKPVVVKTVVLASPPTAVKLTLIAPNRAMVATEDGLLHVFDLGTRYLNQTGGAARGAPGDIVEMFTYPVGANPVALAYVKDKASQAKDHRHALWNYEKDNQFMWALSRGERKASLLHWNPARTALSTFKTLQDSRMTDPLALEDADNHGTESYLVDIANYGSGEILGYAYGDVITWTYDGDASPCPPTAPCKLQNGAPFEFTGAFKLPGKPFHVGGGNIN
ncbi:MAG: hypothetical protein ACRYGA_08840 [Janthinobacterium lividum]